MLGHHYYHNLLAKYIIIVAKLFSDIQIERKDNNGNVVQRIHVPITEGPSAKWNQITTQFPDPEADFQIANILPRMALELVDIRYNSQRKLGKAVRNYALEDGDSSKLKTQYVPNPYILTFELNILTKYVEDGYAIIEQILPFFTPDFTVTANILPEMGIKKNISVVLLGLAPDDNYEGSGTERRTVGWNLTFEINAELYGPILSGSIIKRAQVDFHNMNPNGTVGTTPRHARYVATPGLTANGTPTTSESDSIPYLEIDAEDDWDFIQYFFHYDDNKVYNPVTGADVELPTADDDTTPPPAIG